jgi:hypothetical protein
MPLDQHFHKCDQLLTQLELFMRNNFNISVVSEEIQSELMHTSVIELRKKIQEIEEKKFEKGSTTAGMKNIFENIEQFKSLELSEMRLQTEEIEIETENMVLQFEVIHKEACTLVEQSTEHEIVRIFYEHFKGKNVRAL